MVREKRVSHSAELQQQSEAEKEFARRVKRMHPVKYTLDGTKYRGFVDLMWFVLKIITVDGREFVGDAVSDSHDEPFLKDPIIYLDITEGERAGEGIGFRESRIRSIEVLERPGDDIGPFGPLPKDDDPYWDDDA